MKKLNKKERYQMENKTQINNSQEASGRLASVEETKQSGEACNSPDTTPKTLFQIEQRIKKGCEELNVLDLFCGAGGSAIGINQVGNVKITGIDIQEQPDYPFTFIKKDIRELDKDFLKKFNFIWASPPCQKYTYASKKARNKGKEYPDLIVFTRELLENSGVPYI